MTSEQLQSARAERWRQTSNPILTAEDAKAWMDGVGFCLFLPRRAHFYTPAPSFVEAVAGLPSEAPGREAIESALALLHRLTAESAVVPLNLFGAAAGTVSDQPDFLVTRENLPYVFSLIGGRNWKSGPGAKASPLVLEIWKHLDGAGAQTAAEIQAALGRELTEAAVLRGLVELWNGLRAIPAYDGDATRWELTQARFAAEMTASQKVAQTTALSALVSLYLESAVAASSEEIETFLSPLTARSRVREVVNGLSATRQLGLVSVGAQPLLHVAGSLPEFEEAEPEKAEAEPRERRVPFERRPRAAAEGGEARKPFERRERPQGGRERTGFDRGARRERTGPPRERREAGRPGERREFGPPRERREAVRAGARGETRRPEERERRPYGKKPFEKSARPFGARPFDREKPPTGGKFSPKKFGAGAAKPWQERRERPAAGGERPFRPRREEQSGGERPFRPRREEERGGERRPGKFGGAGKAGEKRFGGPGKFGGPKFGAAKKFGARSGPGERGGARWSGLRPSASRSSGPRPPGSRPPGSRPAGAERSASPGGFKRESPGEKRPFFRERPAKEGESREFRSRPRTGEGARPAKRPGEWKPKPAGGGFSKSGGRGFGQSGRPAFKTGGKPGFKSGGKPAYKTGGKPGFKSGGKPAFKSGGGKPGFKSEGGAGFKRAGFGNSAKPFGKSAGPSGKSGKPFGKTSRPSGRTGGPASRGPKPGGFKPPFRKRKKEGGEDAG